MSVCRGCRICQLRKSASLFVEASVNCHERTIKLRKSDETEGAIFWVQDRDAGFKAQLCWEEVHIWLSRQSARLNSQKRCRGCKRMIEDTRSCLMRGSNGSCVSNSVSDESTNRKASCRSPVLDKSTISAHDQSRI